MKFMNLKSLCAFMAVVSLLLVAVGLTRFGLDLWSHIHAFNSPASSLNYRGLGGALSGIVMFVMFIVLYLWRKL